MGGERGEWRGRGSDGERGGGTCMREKRGRGGEMERGREGERVIEDSAL